MRFWTWAVRTAWEESTSGVCTRVEGGSDILRILYMMFVYMCLFVQGIGKFI